MKFLVIGASGFIGSHVLAYAKSRGFEALGTQSRARHPGLVTFDILHHRIGDCIPSSFLEGGAPIFGVICIKFGTMDSYAQNPELSYKVEVEKTILLIEDLIALGVKPIYLSSSYVFDGSVGYYNEDYPHSPVSVYGRQKAEVEKFLQSRSQDTLVLRLDKNVGSNPSEVHLFSEWYQWMTENRPITCIEGQILSPTFVGDVAKGVVLSCQQGLSGLYNLANSEFFLRDELARQFALAFDREAKIVSKPQAEFGFLDRRPLKSYLDSSRFVKATGMCYTSMREVFNTFKAKLRSGADK
ncbi:sugar nucleotide-binding protein [bacterium]|nr:sugar nucleotide-binding protein [bacterium]